MHLLFYKLKIVFLLFSITSCSSFIFPNFEITKYEYTDEYVLIEFSEIPNLSEFQKSLTFTKDEFKDDYILESNQKQIKIIPQNKIEKEHLYSVLISTDAEDINGNSLITNFEWKFSTKSSSLKPEMLEHILNESSITFNFNSSIKQETFSKSFSLTPQTKYFEYWQNDYKKVSIIFQEPLKNNSRYFVKISSELENIFNNKPNEDITFSFIHNQNSSLTNSSLFCYDENQNCTELSKQLLNNNLKYDSIYKIIFSEKIDLSNINSKIKITPPLDFTIYKNYENPFEIEINFNQIPDRQTEYIMTTSEDITDINQNHLLTNSYRLQFNNEDKKQIQFIKAILFLNYENKIITKETNYQNLLLPVDIYPTVDMGRDTYMDLGIYFSISKSAEQIDYLSAIENIKISSTQNCIEIYPETLQILKMNDIEDSLLEKNEYPNISCALFHCKIKNKDNKGFININISQNIRDSIKNKMDSDIHLTINKR